MSNLIDLKSHSVNTVLNLLLKDRTTNKNIILATDVYNNVAFTTEITKKLVLCGSIDICPRVLKSIEEQTQRTRKKAEVFTPAWICNKMNNYCDAEWFRRENVFNNEQNNDWISTTEKIKFPEGKSWKDYVNSKRLEITCGEAPYIVSRYDMATGNIIPIEKRIGILDRKLRVINENVNTYKSWNQWVYQAFKSVYGYEFQGDNLFIARINLLETFCEYTRDRWNTEPSNSSLKQIANIISWNLWQMDGIHGVIPYIGTVWEQEKEPYQMNLFEMLGITEETKEKTTEKRLETINCNIYDWCNNKVITYKSKEGERMKFDFCIGNPPYQDNTLGENETFAPPVYNKFLDTAYDIADKVEMIHPARFLFNAGSTPKDWNKKMLNDKHLKVLYYEQDSSKVFTNTDIKGGIAITYHDIKCEFGAIKIFTKYSELNDILHKVLAVDGFVSLSNIVVARTAYRLTDIMHKEHPEAINQLSKGHAYDMSTNIFDRLPQIFFDEKPDDNHDYIKILGRENNERVYKFIRRDYVNNVENFKYYKILVPQSNGNGTFGEVIGGLVIEEPNIANTETFISVGKFSMRSEAEVTKKYISTKFARTLLGILKVTQNGNKPVWKYIPLQDFTSSSDIDWSQSISDIDKQLYKKYNLSDEEINFIETNVKEME